MDEFNQWWRDNEEAFENMYRYSFAKKKEIEFPNKLEFVNPYKFNPFYSGESSSVPQSITFKFVIEPESKAHAKFDYQNQTIEINSVSFHNGWPHFKSLLIHELTHAVDPKNNRGDDIADSIINKDKDLSYSSQRFEFDALCNQFSSILLDKLNGEEVLKLIKTNPIHWKPNNKLNGSFILNFLPLRKGSFTKDFSMLQWILLKADKIDQDFFSPNL